MQRPTRYLRWIVTGLVALVSVNVQAELIELAQYRLGENDSQAVPGRDVRVTVDEIGFDDLYRDMDGEGGVTYSDDTPPGIVSSSSVEFDGDFGSYLVADGTPWHSFYPGFRVGMEAWVKPDPGMEGEEMVLFSNGGLYRMTIGTDGFFHANQTPEGITPVEWDEWQHVAFWTTGSFWQVYVNGEPQYDPVPEFNYGGGGLATIGADQNGDLPFQGWIDEHRIFTWTGPFNPVDLLYFQQRTPDVNGDGKVDGADYDIWREHVGADVADLTPLEARALGDVNGDLAIDLDDFALIKEHRTPAARNAPAPVPEPSAWALLLLGAGFSGAYSRRRAAPR